MLVIGVNLYLSLYFGCLTFLACTRKVTKEYPNFLCKESLTKEKSLRTVTRTHTVFPKCITLTATTVKL